MSKSTAARMNLRQRGVVAAGLVALTVFAFMVAQQVVQSLLTLVQDVGQDVDANAPLADVLRTSGPPTLIFVTLSTLPFAVGVFFSLWQFAPIGAGLRIGHVMTRALLAAGVGAVVTLVSFIVVAVGNSIAGMGARRIFGSSIEGIASELARIPGFAVAASVGTLLGGLPLVALGCVLLWNRLRDSDRDYHVEGMIDV